MSATMPAVLPVPMEDLPSHFQRAVQIRAKEEKRERRFGATKTALLVVVGAYAAYLTYRNEQLVTLAADNANRVIYNTIRDDGTLVSTAMYTSLPPKVQGDNTLNSLWNYVFWRECYSAAEAPRANYNVQRMSDERVGREWREYISPANERSPQNALGKRRHYFQCEPVSYAPIGTEGNRYNFRFMRHRVNEQGQRVESVMMYAAMAYRLGIYPTDENAWIDRTVFNAAGVQVWEYPGAYPEGVQPNVRRVAGGGR